MLAVKITSTDINEQSRKFNALTEIEKAPVEVLEFLAELGRDYPKSQAKLMSPLTQMMLRKACK